MYANVVADYLQARFSEKSKSDLKVKAGKKAKVEDSETWEALLYKDEKGIYIPSMQIKGAIINGGKSIKKKPHGSFKNDVRAYMFIEPEKIYIGKQKPDFINESYPKRQTHSQTLANTRKTHVSNQMAPKKITKPAFIDEEELVAEPMDVSPPKPTKPSKPEPLIQKTQQLLKVGESPVYNYLKMN